MKRILLTITLICTFVFCQAQVDMAALKTDPDFLAYRKISAKVKTSMTSHYYVLPKNYAALQPELRKNRDPENIKRILKANGMTHVDEFMADMTLQGKYLSNFMKKHPELMKLPPAERSRVFVQLLTGR